LGPLTAGVVVVVFVVGVVELVGDIVWLDLQPSNIEETTSNTAKNPNSTLFLTATSSVN
jgi:hypothetical protein